MWGSISKWSNDSISFEQESVAYKFRLHEKVLEVSKESKEQSSCDILTRLIVEKGKDSISINPILPNRPIILELKDALKLPSGQSYSFYSSIPLGIGIANTHKKNILAEYYFTPLKSTWHGKSPVNGELCYNINAVPSKSPALTSNYLAHVHITVKNNSSFPADIKKLKVQTQSLSIWTDSNNQYFIDRLLYTYNDIEGFSDKPITKPPKGINTTLKKQFEPRLNLKHNFITIMRHPWTFNQ